MNQPVPSVPGMPANATASANPTAGQPEIPLRALTLTRTAADEQDKKKRGSDSRVLEKSKAVILQCVIVASVGAKHCFQNHRSPKVDDAQKWRRIRGVNLEAQH